MSAPTSTNRLLISADSHMAEPPDLWEKNLPAKLRDRAPRFPDVRQLETPMDLRAGGWDPHERLKDMAVDGVAAEVLYTTKGNAVWHPDDLELEEACVRVYNDFLIDFCKVAPERLWGLGLVSLYDIEHAIAELERIKLGGLKGAAIWIAAPESLPYSSEHYERFWAAAQDMEMPLGMHINARYTRRATDPGGLRQLHSVNGHKFDGMSSLGQIIASGVMERYPRLQVAVAEIGIGWIPFWLQELDYYTAARTNLPRPPSEYFRRQVTSTFISDAVGGVLLREYDWLQDVAVWSSDYPHIATVWPDSTEIMQADLGHLPADVQEKVIWRNAARVFNHGQPPVPADEAPEDYAADVRLWVQKTGAFGWMSRTHNAPEAGRVGSSAGV
jgi:predicted TIM-barrel fold metal-dependent hydrolase